MDYAWDIAKNYLKHGVWFEEAKTIWSDPRSQEFYDIIHSVDEERFLRIGLSSLGRILLVVFCERQEALRLISARRASSQEREVYEKGI